MPDSDLKATPLAAFHAAHGARLVPFAGWEMPVQYTSILDEHRAVRRDVGLFDVSHMGEAVVTGPQAAQFLDYVATNRLGDLPPGQARYTLLCNETGGCVDDVIVYHRAEGEFLAVLNASNAERDLAWLRQHAADFDCTITDESAATALLALQGPHAADLLERLAPHFPELSRFGCSPAVVAGVELFAARTGYTGEDGFELFCAVGQAHSLAEALVEAGATPCGLGARDSLRLEAGYPLYGHEIDADISPLEAGLGFAVKLKKERFYGKEALAVQKETGVPRKIVWFTLEGKRQARAGMRVLAGEAEVGDVRSGAFSPVLECPIGSALVDARRTQAALEVDCRGKRLPLLVKKPPLHAS